MARSALYVCPHLKVVDELHRTGTILIFYGSQEPKKYFFKQMLCVEWKPDLLLGGDHLSKELFKCAGGSIGIMSHNQ